MKRYAFRQLRDGRSGHGLRHRQPFVLACSAVAVLMGAGGYQAIEDTCRKFTSRQLRALGCQRNGDGNYVPPSDSTLYRVLSKKDHWLERRHQKRIAVTPEEIGLCGCWQVIAVRRERRPGAPQPTGRMTRCPNGNIAPVRASQMKYPWRSVGHGGNVLDECGSRLLCLAP